jgi:hypothetical protein
MSVKHTRGDRCPHPDCAAPVLDARQDRIDAAARAALTGIRAQVPGVQPWGCADAAQEAYDQAEAMEAERALRLAK